MLTLHELIARQAQNGAISWIGVRPARRAVMEELSRCDLSQRGIAGDHGASEKRAVTLIQGEYLPVIGAMLGRGAVMPSDLRRNLVVTGINLGALKGRRLQIGQAVLEVTGICAPCSRMEETLGFGGYSAMRGHGGWCARVIRPGGIALGDVVVPLQRDVC